MSRVTRTSGKIETFRKANARRSAAYLFGGTTGSVPLSEQKPGSPQLMQVVREFSEPRAGDAFHAGPVQEGQ